MSAPKGSPVGRVSKGPRDSYFSDPAIDKLHTMLMITIQELAVARDRIDSLERLLESSAVIKPDAVDNFVLDEKARTARSSRQSLMIKRIFRATEKEYKDRLAPVDLGNGVFS